MPTLVTNSNNRGLVQVAETAPAGWERIEIGKKLPMPHLWPAIILCEEKTFDLLPKYPPNCRLIVFDSVRKPLGFFRQFKYAVFTLDAPAEGATWLWTPIAEKYYEKPEPKTDDVIFIGRVNYRQEQVEQLRQLGVKIIPRDEKRSYQEYANELKRARAVVNLCTDRVTGKPQLKGRVIETLFAGTHILEQRNDLTASKLEHEVTRTWLNQWADFEELKKLLFEYHWPEPLAQGWGHLKFSTEKFWRIVANA